MRVLMIGDSPHLKTGFGRVNMIAAQRFLEEGWEVVSIGGLLKEPPKEDKGIITVVPEKEEDLLGVYQIDPTVDKYKPDVLYATADIGSITHMMQGTPDMPHFAYIPIEGGPVVNEMWRKVLSTGEWLATSKYGSGLAKTQFNRDIDYSYHGVDHDVFKVTGNRDEVRKVFHWDDKFVITCVATNVRRKQLPRLIEAVAILKHQYKQKDVVLYIHTIPFQYHFLEGWNLFDIVDLYDVREMVQFHPMMKERNAFIPEITGDPNFPGMVEILNASDLSVNVSQVEGVSLTNIEAMACGLPVLTTKYAAGWEMVEGAGRGLPVHDWEVHKSGTLYANVHPPTVAKEILRLIRAPRDLQRMSEGSLRRAQDFQWSDFTSKLIPAVEHAIVRYQERNHIEETEDTGREDPSGSQPVPGPEVEDSTTQGDHRVEGQGQDPDGQGPQDGTMAPKAEAQEEPVMAHKILATAKGIAKW